MCACLSAQAGVQSPIRRTLPPWIPAFELVNLSVSSRDQHRASFETAASRLPQDEVFLNAIKEVPHPEEAQGAVSKDAGCSCSAPLTGSFAGMTKKTADIRHSQINTCCSRKSVGAAGPASAICGTTRH